MYNPNLQEHQCVFNYAHKNIRYSFWSNAAQIDTVFFLGAGQIGKTIKDVANDAPPGVAVVGGAPHWETGGGGDIEEFMLRYMQDAFDTIIFKFGLKRVNLVAESQAAPVAMVIANQAPQRVGNLVLIYPLGFAAKAYGSTKARRLKTFKRRLLAHGLSILLHPRNIAVSWSTVRAVLREPSLSVLFKKYAAGLSYDSTEDCRAVAIHQKHKNAKFVIFLAEKDRLFPLNEMMEVFEAAKIKDADIRVVLGAPHSSVGMRVGKNVLMQAIEAAQS
jgi:pimeloyl-ACP methyl ester carboxylesterase